MANAWGIPAVGWGIIVVGWWISPVIAFFLPKIFSFLEFDLSKKVWDLKIHIVPELQKMLRAVDQARMLQRGEVPDVSMLDDMAAMLRHAREDAEDIFDDAQEFYSNSSQRLYGAVKACIARCVEILWREPTLDELADMLDKVWKSDAARNMFRDASRGDATQLRHREELFDIQRHVNAAQRGDATKLRHRHELARLAKLQKQLQTTSIGDPTQMRRREELANKLVGFYGGLATCKSIFMWLLQQVRKIIALRRSEDVLPVITRCSDAASHEPVPVVAPSGSSGQWLSCLCSSFEFFMNCSRSILYWIGVARFYRNWSFEVVGITSDQENAGVLDSLLTAILRQNLKKRIEKVESTISDVKKSPLLGVPSKSAAEDIANKNRSRITSASNRKVFGCEALRDSIMAKLRENPHGNSPCYSAIGIYGVAGSGKTTFARYTRDYIKKECKEDKLFDTIMCIHVSETFSVKDIFHEMLKDITKEHHSNISNHEELKKKLKESLRGKRFFLILDDLWVKNKNDPQLEELTSLLNVGLNGSKILVTARTKVAAGALCADEPIKMPDLGEDQYLSMFMHYALGGTTSVTDKEFKRVGRMIAEKLHGSPIAAVTVAGRLRANRDIRFWKNTAEHDMHMLNDSMDALWWSYHQLSPDMKRCFEYCNIFPRRFRMKKVNLIHLWIAQGFVKTSCAGEDMEDVAEDYIQELVSCSFLQPEKTWDDQEFFTIHDLLHDLADMVTRTDFFRIENESSQRGECWKGDIPPDVRHLFIQNYNAELITEEILRLKNVRTLIINVIGRHTQVEDKVIDDICKKLLKLRVLAFAFSEISSKKSKKVSVPESLSQLKHLRYLAFRIDYCNITLPSTLNKLQHIQLLDFGDGHILEFTFAELVNLRHIFSWPRVNLPYVGRLTSLQTLPGFEVRNKEGLELKQLRDLNKLRGRLEIFGLENVKSKREALEASLATKKRITCLSLFWHEDIRRDPSEIAVDVLEGLCPPVGLEKLEIFEYKGSRYPDWMVGKQNGGPKHLQELLFSDCNRLEPGHLVDAFPHLRVLRLYDCSWDALPGNMENLMSLKELLICLCFNIRLLPTMPLSLEKFTLSRCNDYCMETCEIVGHPNWQKIEHIPQKNFLYRPRRS